MTDTFTFPSTGQPVGQTTFRTRKAQFGDGYSQVVADGINNRVDTWPLTFVGKWSAISPIKTFLDAHSGNVSFNWTPPKGVVGLWQAPTYTLQPMGADVYQIAVTFNQVFGP